MRKQYLLLIVSALLFLSSCKLDPAELEDKRDNLTKSWHAVLTDGQVPQEYQIDITKDADNKEIIYLSNFINNGVKATVNIKDLDLIVNQQTLGNSVVSGTGKVTSDYQKITFNIKIDNTNYTLTLTGGQVNAKKLKF